MHAGHDVYQLSITKSKSKLNEYQVVSVLDVTFGSSGPFCLLFLFGLAAPEMSHSLSSQLYPTYMYCQGQPLKELVCHHSLLTAV